VASSFEQLSNLFIFVLLRALLTSTLCLESGDQFVFYISTCPVVNYIVFSELMLSAKCLVLINNYFACRVSQESV
jgi:hypothetical protein